MSWHFAAENGEQNKKIPNWEHLVSVIRSRNISAHIVLQTYSQLKGMYKDHAETIAGCCSSLLFLGVKEESSLKMVVTMLGKVTIDTYNISDTRGTSRSYGLNYQKLGKELKSMDELAVMPSSRCVLQVQGVRSFYSRKYDLTRHPLYKYTGGAYYFAHFTINHHFFNFKEVNLWISLIVL